MRGKTTRTEKVIPLRTQALAAPEINVFQE
jgi:hypothetical protein